jgi:hypothetical protein
MDREGQAWRMTLHYHGTRIWPRVALYELAGRNFCVPFSRPDDVRICHEIGQSVMLDNGAYVKWKTGKATNWSGYYLWADEWLAYPTTWAVIPDVIDGGAEQQDELLTQWPFGFRGAPVWHMDEPLSRLLTLAESWPRICFGSTAEFAVVQSSSWQRRMDEAFNTLARRHRQLPWIHMLRGMACVGERWPFASVDSTDVARNHNRNQNTPLKLAQRWDRVQCSAKWHIVELGHELDFGGAVHPDGSARELADW